MGGKEASIITDKRQDGGTESKPFPARERPWSGSYARGSTSVFNILFDNDVSMSIL